MLINLNLLEENQVTPVELAQIFLASNEIGHENEQGCLHTLAHAQTDASKLSGIVRLEEESTTLACVQQSLSLSLVLNHMASM